MARFDIQGMDQLIAQMKEMQQLTGPVAEAMLMAAAADVRAAWQEAALQHGHKDTGQMIASIGYPRKPSSAGDVMYIDIYPQGKNTGGVRNAEVAFVLHYGTKKMPGSRWIDDADKASGPAVSATMQQIWQEYLRTGTVPTINIPNWTGERREAKNNAQKSGHKKRR